MLRFMSRDEAGRLLGASLSDYRNRCDVVVTPVHVRAEEVAEKLAVMLSAVYAASAESLRDITGGTVILVDDGFDSSERVYETSLVARDRGAVVIVAVAPVGRREVYQKIISLVDRCFCLATPAPFHSTGFWYDDTMQIAAQMLFSCRPAVDLPHKRRVNAFRERVGR